LTAQLLLQQQQQQQGMNSEANLEPFPTAPPHLQQVCLQQPACRTEPPQQSHVSLAQTKTPDHN
jgi:hypothetical protein